jgi:predicted site-specific integrase-resolvase
MSHSTSAYLPAAKVHELYSVARSTLRSWAEEGKVEALRAGGEGKRLYKLADVERVLGVDHAKKTQAERQCVCYARVSSQHQRGDLERQVAFLRSHYPDHVIYQDVGSGLNFKRARFVALLDAVHAGTVSEIVVTDKDRLCRFGADLVQWVLDKTGTRLMVHSDTVGAAVADEPDTRHELSDDIISIITFFTARSNGQRSARNRKRRREDAEASEAPKNHKKNRKAASGAHQEDPPVSDV